MKTRFLHLADCHLGYRQYNSDVRAEDIAQSFWWIVDKAIEEQVDFVVLAGDLFEKRAINAATLDHAVKGLRNLADAGIPCLTVEGNHELSYHRDKKGWIEYLNEDNLLTLLHPKFDGEKAILSPHDGVGGAFVEPQPGLRVYGLRYMGSALSEAIKQVGTGLNEADNSHVEYTIFIAHTGVAGMFQGDSDGLQAGDLAVLRPHADYLALGHIHMPYDVDGWVYNPGSPDTNSMAEATWPDRGYYIVEVDTTQVPKHSAVLYSNPRRSFIRLNFAVDGYATPDECLNACCSYIERKGRDYVGDPPVVELRLSGQVAFSRQQLRIKEIEDKIREVFSPIHCQVPNNTYAETVSKILDYDPSKPKTRDEMRRDVFIDLLGMDERFKDNREGWADLTIEMMNLALSNAPPETIVDVLDKGHKRLTV